MTEPQLLWEYQIQLRRIAEHRRRGIESSIRREYKQVLQKLQVIIAKYYAAYGNSDDSTMTQGDLRSAGQYKTFLQDVLDNLDGIAEPVDKQIRQTIEDTYTTCYNGMVNAVKQSTDNTQLGSLLSGLYSATPETVKNIVENPMQKLTLSTVFSRRRNQIVKSTKKTLAVGLASGDSYTRMAQRIADTLNGDYKKAMRIVRTEANRAINRGFQDVTEEASEMLLGSDYVEVKEWCSMEDESVRSTHQHLNGKKLHSLDMFESSGAKADCPGSFGVAKEDINCRCFLMYSFMSRDEFIAQGGVIPDSVLQKEKEQGLTSDGDGGIIESDNVEASDIAKLINTMPNQQDVQEFMDLLNNNSNGAIKRAYKNYCSQLNSVRHTSCDGYYSPNAKALVYCYSQQRNIIKGQSKYSVLAHEYGHYIDGVAQFHSVTYREIEQLNKAISTKSSITWFKKTPSLSDKFLSALRNDKETLDSMVFDEAIRGDLFSTDASAGVQDAICGMFGTAKTKMKWQHRDSYYDRIYLALKSAKLEKIIKSVYQDLGFAVRSQSKVKAIVRNYETASEMWANIMSAETCGGLELEYIKKYLPSSYNAYIEIMKGLE